MFEHSKGGFQSLNPVISIFSIHIVQEDQQPSTMTCKGISESKSISTIEEVSNTLNQPITITTCNLLHQRQNTETFFITWSLEMKNGTKTEKAVIFYKKIATMYC